jgi:hypothetical protein
MKRSPIATAVVVLCALTAGALAQQAKLGEFWIPANMHWSHPRGAPEGESVASTVILYFGQNGIFARDECWVIREGQSITISNGDPHNEWVGSWEPIADGMRMTYRLVRRTVERKGEQLPGREIKASAEMPRSGLKIGRQLFRSMTPTNATEYAAGYDALAKINADSNKNTNSAR